jgi:hypothetical protein
LASGRTRAPAGAASTGRRLRRVTEPRGRGPPDGRSARHNDVELVPREWPTGTSRGGPMV